MMMDITIRVVESSIRRGKNGKRTKIIQVNRVMKKCNVVHWFCIGHTPF